MKNLFADTNIIVDFLINREPFSLNAASLFEMALQGKINIYVSAISFNNIHYTLRRSIGHKNVVALLEKFTAFVTIVDVTDSVIKNALKSDFADFEDAIQYYSALSHKGIEAIVTRDTKGFKKSTLKVFDPVDALLLLQR